jgi:hypothetical protein
MIETLYAIPNIQGYLITRSGKVWSERHSRFLTEKIKSNGYRIIEYYDLGVRLRQYIHIIIAQLFVDNPENKPEVNHKDGIKLNCEPSNLEWVTHAENLEHANRTGLIKNRPKGSAVHFAKLNEFQVKEIRQSSLSSRELSRVYGIAYQNIQNVKLRKTWAHVIA